MKPTRICPVCNQDGPADEACAYCGDRPPELRIGDVIDGRYRIEAILGRGGFGVVFRGTHLGLGAPIAIKFLLHEAASRADTRARFRREARALTQLRHPSIVTAYDFGEEAGVPYLVMELATGTPLVEQLPAYGVVMSPEKIVRLMCKVLDVLEVAHAAGIVHRDLKPENIITHPTAAGGDEVKVLDFGLAFTDDGPGSQRITASSTVMGTPTYMSPEQCRGRDIGPPTDVYAVGVMLYELLSGQLPFSGDNSAALMVQHMFLEPPPLSSVGLHREIPPGIEAAVRGALAKDPHARPSAHALRERLLAALEGTDEASRAIALANARVAAAGLSREERALPRPDAHQLATDWALPASQRAFEGAVTHGHVVVVGLSDARLSPLREALAVAGVQCVRLEQGLPPVVDADGQPWPAIVLGPDIDAVAALTAIRSNPISVKTPVMVVGLPSADAAPELIRVGASDVSLATVSEHDVAKRVLRLLRRKR